MFMFFYLKCIIFMYLGTGSGSTNHGGYVDIRGQLCGIFLSFYFYRFSWDEAQVFRLVWYILYLQNHLSRPNKSVSSLLPSPNLFLRQEFRVSQPGLLLTMSSER